MNRDHRTYHTYDRQYTLILNDYTSNGAGNGSKIPFPPTREYITHCKNENSRIGRRNVSGLAEMSEDWFLWFDIRLDEYLRDIVDETHWGYINDTYVWKQYKKTNQLL